jgi:hypothetical protein
MFKSEKKSKIRMKTTRRNLKTKNDIKLPKYQIDKIS